MTLQDAGPTSGQLRSASEAATRLCEALAVPPPPETDDDRSPSSPRWLGQSLARGAAGIAVLHGVRAHAGLGDQERVHTWLAAATGEDLSAGKGAGLWFGAAAVAFAVSTASHGQYSQANQVLDSAVTRMTQARLEAAAARIATATRPSLAEFDLVHGLAGLGAYLLRRDVHHALLRQVLAYLVQLTRPLHADDQAGTSVPGWWTNAVPSGQPVDAFPSGFADLSMAHGISGPLALLALAMRQGISVPGQRAAIETICQWLDTWRQDGPAGPWWPERINFAEHRTGRSTSAGPTRPSWCYGTPGLARAQQLAALATGNHIRQEQAEHALESCLSDPAQLGRIIDPALCHGWAGLVATARCAAADAHTPSIAAYLPCLLDRLVDPACGDWPLPGLINGRAGIAATLHSLAGGTSGGFEACLLIN